MLHQEVVRLNAVATGSRDMSCEAVRMADRLIEDLLHSRGGVDFELVQNALQVRNDLRLLQTLPPPPVPDTPLPRQTASQGTKRPIKKEGPLQRGRCSKKAKQCT